MIFFCAHVCQSFLIIYLVVWREERSLSHYDTTFSKKCPFDTSYVIEKFIVT